MIPRHPVFQFIALSSACLFCGWVGAFSMPDLSIWPALFLALSGFYCLYSLTKTAAHAFLAGFFFGIGYFVTGLWWIGNALLVDGNEFAWVWPISVIGLPTLLGLFTGTYCAMARLVASPDTLKGFLAFVFFLTFSEWVRGNAFTGFPWNLYGYVWADHLPMAQASFYTGAYGLTLVTVFWAALGGFIFVSKHAKKQKAALAAVGALSLVMVFVLGNIRLAHAPRDFDVDTGIIVVQPNIPQNMKWDPDAVQANFLKTLDLTASANLGHAPENIVIVWPETAISPSIYGRDDNMARIRDTLEGFSDTKTYLVTGILRRFEKEPGVLRYGNSMALMNERLSALAIYDKHHLVPFGEFIPFQDWIPLRPVAAFQGFERGAGPTVIRQDTLPGFSPLVCYEVIFPDRILPPNKSRPAFIINSTNDGWYGDSAGPYQHFSQSRLRAIEEGLPLIRSANTGISGIIDGYGRIVYKTRIFENSVLASMLPKGTAYSLYAWRWSFQVMLFIAGMFLMLCTIQRMQKTNANHP